MQSDSQNPLAKFSLHLRFTGDRKEESLSVQVCVHVLQKQLPC